MNLMKVIITVSLLTSLSVFAHDDHTDEEKNHKQPSVEGMVKEAKTSRRKKVEMCHDCGKPEVNCDCPDEVKAKEQAAKKAAAGQ